MTQENFYQIVELTKHFGAVVGTPGISKEVQEKGNRQLLRLLDALDNTVNATLASNAGLIT